MVSNKSTMNTDQCNYLNSPSAGRSLNSVAQDGQVPTKNQVRLMFLTDSSSGGSRSCQTGGERKHQRPRGGGLLFLPSAPLKK